MESTNYFFLLYLCRIPKTEYEYDNELFFIFEFGVATLFSLSVIIINISILDSPFQKIHCCMIFLYRIKSEVNMAYVYILATLLENIVKSLNVG